MLPGRAWVLALALPALAGGLRLPASSAATGRQQEAFSRRAALGLLAGASPLATNLQAASAALATATAPNALCDPCVSTAVSARGQQITLVGTAHISEDSALLVRRVIRELKPDTVMIEVPIWS